MAHTTEGYMPRPNWLLKKIHSNLNFYDKEYSREHYEEGTTVTPETFMGHRIRYKFEEFDELFIAMDKYDYLLLRHKSIPAYKTAEEIQQRMSV